MLSKEQDENMKDEHFGIFFLGVKEFSNKCQFYEKKVDEIW